MSVFADEQFKQLYLKPISRPEIRMPAFGSRRQVRLSVPEEYRLSEPCAGRDKGRVARRGAAFLKDMEVLFREEAHAPAYRGKVVYEGEVIEPELFFKPSSVHDPVQVRQPADISRYRACDA